jgi:alkylation response protein AidB-like acyl-CoA dehydrogenase
MGNEILDAVHAAGTLVRAEAAACEEGHRLTPAVVDAIRDAGVFRMTMSRAMGGPELSPLEQLDVLEALAFADGSAGWCGMINSDGGYVSAFLDPTAAKDFYPSLDLPTAVVGAPTGQAVLEDAGYRVTGRWTFASGSTHCQRFFLNCLVLVDGVPQPGANGLPLMRVMGLPADDVTVHDTWRTTGMAATASGDVSVEGALVPPERTFNLFDDVAFDPSPLYRWRWMFFANLPAVPLGVARAAIAEATNVAMAKVSGPTLTLAREDPVVQVNVARATALVGSAKAYVYDTLGALWDSLVAGDDATPAQWTDCRLALTNAFHSSKEAVSLLYEALGTAGIYRSSPLDRHMRDITTMSQHMLSQTKTYVNCGRSLLGLDPGGLAFS